MMKNGNAPIHPTGFSQSGTGLTKREYFAAMAMQGLQCIFSNENMISAYADIALHKGLTTQQLIAEMAVMHADALLKQLEQK